jgi:lipid A 3-O-deacylase
MKPGKGDAGLWPCKNAMLLLVLTVASCVARTLAEDATVRPAQGEIGLSAHPLQLGLFVQGGFPPTYEIHDGSLHYGVELQLFSAGIEAGIQSRYFKGPFLLRGRGEAMLEIMPFWMAQYPPQLQVLRFNGSTFTESSHWNGERFHGASVTPFLLRWNFSRRDSARFVPWAQLGGGLLWTNHKFPYSYLGGTSVINFTPQLGVGVNIFNNNRRSVGLSMKAVHISNASLGDHNPGLNITLQFSTNYSWWK